MDFFDDVEGNQCQDCRDVTMHWYQDCRDVTMHCFQRHLDVTIRCCQHCRDVTIRHCQCCRDVTMHCCQRCCVVRCIVRRKVKMRPYQVSTGMLRYLEEIPSEIAVIQWSARLQAVTLLARAMARRGSQQCVIWSYSKGDEVLICVRPKDHLSGDVQNRDCAWSLKKYTCEWSWFLASGSPARISKKIEKDNFFNLVEKTLPDAHLTNAQLWDATGLIHSLLQHLLHSLHDSFKPLFHCTLNIIEDSEQSCLAVLRNGFLLCMQLSTKMCVAAPHIAYQLFPAVILSLHQDICGYIA